MATKLIILCIFYFSYFNLYAGPFSAMDSGALSDELTSKPAAKRNAPTSESLDQSKDLLDFSKSDVWEVLQQEYLGDNARVLFDPNVRVIMQDIVEEPHEVSLVVKFPEYLKKTFMSFKS